MNRPSPAQARVVLHRIERDRKPIETTAAVCCALMGMLAVMTVFWPDARGAAAWAAWYCLTFGTGWAGFLTALAWFAREPAPPDDQGDPPAD